MKTKIGSYVFQHGMSLKKWMNDLCTMYNELCNLDPDGKMMLDDAFVRQMIELMPRDDDWRTVSGSLMNELQKTDLEKRKLSLQYIMEQI